MKISYTPHFKRDYKSLPREIKKKFKKQIKFLLENFWHPSLRCKKYDKKRGIWQARVNRYYRFYFLIKGDTYILLEIKPHPK
jgi:mRNA-degrading endonuclease RelE of RelBE toxin-antitoxin system